jgi:hypothetical protein
VVVLPGAAGARGLLNVDLELEQPGHHAGNDVRSLAEMTGLNWLSKVTSCATTARNQLIEGCPIR